MRIVIVRDVKKNLHEAKGLSVDHSLPGSPKSVAPARVRSEDLLRGQSELVIEHQGREYRLRITQNGKLILTA